MGITYANETICVTGGSQDDPYTMADLDADGTVGTYITPGGYANKEYSVSKDLVIGSEDADTFFDLSGSIIKMDPGKYLTVYTTALRGGSMGPTFAETVSGMGTIPFTEEKTQKSRLERIRKLYIERINYLDNRTGAWVASAGAPRVVAVCTNDEIADGPYS